MEKKTVKFPKRNLLFPCLLIVFFSACTEENPGQVNPSDSSPPYAATKTMGKEGGTLTVDNPQSTIFKAAVSIPRDQFSHPTTLTLQPGSLPAPLPPALQAAGTAVNFGPDGLLFDPPALLTLPYHSFLANGSPTPDLTVQVRYFDPIAGQWVPMDVRKRDRENKTLSFESRHFSVYIAATDVGQPPAQEPLETLLPGEYFIGEPGFVTKDGTPRLVEKGNINRPGLPKGSPFHLFARFYPHEGVRLIVDQHPSLNEAVGYRADLNAEGTGAVLDVFPIFEKVKASGDSRRWRWEAVFVPELTRIEGYTAIDPQDFNSPEIPEDRRLYARIETLNAEEVLITWGFDLPAKQGWDSMLCIAFEATYLGDAKGETP